MTNDADPLNQHVFAIEKFTLAGRERPLKYAIMSGTTIPEA